MRKLFHRLTALLCALTLSCAGTAAAVASRALGDDLTHAETLIHQETQLSTNVFWSTSQSDFRTENYITYYPNAQVSPVVYYGDVTTQMTTLSNTVRTLESQGYRVVGGINGDFFEMGTGVPVGLVVTDGIIRSSDGGLYALGFRRDGSAVIGRPQLQINADFGYDWDWLRVQRRIDAINKVREASGGIYLFTYDFNRTHSTGNSEWGIDAVCDIIDGSLTIGGDVHLRVVSVEEKAGLTYMGPNQMVLSVNSRSNEWWLEAMRNLPVGSEITITVRAQNPVWNEVWQGLGSLYNLVEDGHRASGIPTASNAPRTAVGLRPDGSILFYTIDGRVSGHSIGTSLNSTADRLIELGCTYAVCMDGGGSTTISVTMPDANYANTINVPSEGTERAVSSALLLLASGQPSGILDHFYLRPDRPYVLAGSLVNFSVNAVDSAFFPMYPVPEFALSAADGAVWGNTLQTPVWGGDITVTASGAGRSGSTVVHAIAMPDSVTIRNDAGTALSALTLNPGDSIRLHASAVWAHKDLPADESAFQWIADPALGAFYEPGVFTATTPGNGSIAVTAGQKTVYLPLNVVRPALKELESFETLPQGYGENAELALASGGEEVRYGHASGALRYSLFNTAVWRAVQPLPALDGIYGGVTLWVLGDGSGSLLSLLTADSTGFETAVPAVTLDFDEWRQIYVPLARGASVTGYSVTLQSGYGWTNDPDTAYGSDGWSTIWLDQIVTAFPGYADMTPPVVDITYSAGEIWGTVWDETDSFPPKESVTLAWNGTAISNFYYEPERGFFYFAVPDYGYQPGRVTVTGRDASGNLGRASVEIPFQSYGAHPFTDIDGYWAADYIDYLYNQGIAEPYPDGGYHPYDAITRVEFAVMLARAAGLEQKDYSWVTLPYADLDQIPVSALPALRALYAENIMRGTDGEDGQLYLLPNNGLTRAQASAMIGRSQNRGYAAAEYLAFPDAGTIPAYARSHIQIMVARGILSGFSDGTFRPQDPVSRGQMAKILYFLS